MKMRHMFFFLAFLAAFFLSCFSTAIAQGVTPPPFLPPEPAVSKDVTVPSADALRPPSEVTMPACGDESVRRALQGAQGMLFNRTPLEVTRPVTYRPYAQERRREKGYINVWAYTKTCNSGRKIEPTSIRVHEVGNSSRSWYNSWSGTSGSTYQSLYCSGARVGEYFRVRVAWSDGTVSTTDIRLREKYRDLYVQH
jgi:hypothetical protein